MPTIESITRPVVVEAWCDNMVAVHQEYLENSMVLHDPTELDLPLMHPSDTRRLPGMTLQHATDIAHEFSNFRDTELAATMQLAPNRIIIKSGRVLMGLTETEQFINERMRVTGLLQRLLHVDYAVVPAYTNICLGSLSHTGRHSNKRRGDIIHTLTDKVMPRSTSLGSAVLRYSFGEGKLQISI